MGYRSMICMMFTGGQCSDRSPAFREPSSTADYYTADTSQPGSYRDRVTAERITTTIPGQTQISRGNTFKNGLTLNWTW